MDDSDATGVDRIRCLLSGTPALLDGFKLCSARLLATDECGLVLSGSCAAGTVDAYSDLDFQLRFAGRAPTAEDAERVRRQLSECGDVLSWFPATHIGLPHLVIMFLELDGEVVKIDVELVDGTTPVKPGAIVLKETPTGQIAPEATATALVEPDDDAECYRRFTGWIWYTFAKIARGELLEAHDALHFTRREALVPSLRRLHGLPQEGFRRLETSLPGDDLERLRKTASSSDGRTELARALLDTSAFFSEVHSRIAQGRAADHREAALDRMIELIRARI